MAIAHKYRGMSKSDLIVELEDANRQTSANLKFRSLTIFGRIIIVGICGWTIVECVRYLAGKFTFADIGLDLNANFDKAGGPSGSLQWPIYLSVTAVVALLIFVYLWYRERKLRKRTVERLHKRIRELEQTIDPGRSSARLTSKGETTPMDI